MDSTVTLMHKPVTPQASDAYLTSSFDRVAGFVLRAPDAVTTRTPAEVFELFGLGFPGSPHRPDVPYVDILRFPATPQLRLEDATGGTDEASRLRVGGVFVDRAPFTGTGFVRLRDTVAPLYWLVHCRVPAGSALVRLSADGSERPVATYADTATGWVTPDGQPSPAPSALSRHVGPVARWNDALYAADPVDDTVVLAATTPTPGFEPTSAGRWRRVVARTEVTELFEMDVTATWNGLPVRVVDGWTEPSGETVARVFSLAHNADLAEGLRMTKTDAACYEATVPTATLTDLRTAQRIPSAWAT